MSAGNIAMNGPDGHATPAQARRQLLRHRN